MIKRRRKDMIFREEERKAKQRIQEYIYRMPKDFEEYVNYLVDEEKYAYCEIRNNLASIAVYYDILANLKNKIAYKITPDDIQSTPHEVLENRSELYSYDNDFRQSLIDYQEFLIRQGKLEHLTVKLRKKYIETEHPKKRNPRKIKSPDKLRMFKDDDRPYSKTTIDLKYSMDKKFYTGYMDYTYMIYDHGRGDYFRDENGEIIEIKEYMKARDFIKNLYK